MNSSNHILIGTIVYEYLKEKYGIVLFRPSFLKGNTCPDHGISFLRPHRMKYCNRMVRKKTVKLCRADWEIISAKASKKIGILCHYYADFFCCAHNPQFSGNLKEHIKHEDQLLRFMDENYHIFQQIDYITDANIPESASEINNRMRNLFQNKPTREDDYGMELVCAIQACVELSLSICLEILFRNQEIPNDFHMQKIA
jgi:hypothetical protein